MTMRDFFFDDPFFKSSWEDFDKVREKMFQDSRDMVCMSNNIMVDSDIQEKKSTEVKSSGGEVSTDRTPWPSGRMDGCSPGDGCCQVLAMSLGTWICSKAQDGHKMVSRQFIRKYR